MILYFASFFFITKEFGVLVGLDISPKFRIILFCVKEYVDVCYHKNSEDDYRLINRPYLVNILNTWTNLIIQMYYKASLTDLVCHNTFPGKCSILDPQPVSLKIYIELAKQNIIYWYATNWKYSFTHIINIHVRAQWHFNVSKVFLPIFWIGNFSPTIVAEIVQQTLTAIDMKAVKWKF